VVPTSGIANLHGDLSDPGGSSFIPFDATAKGRGRQGLPALPTFTFGEAYGFIPQKNL
jgi:hypothetical protein